MDKVEGAAWGVGAASALSRAFSLVWAPPAEQAGRSPCAVSLGGVHVAVGSNGPRSGGGEHRPDKWFGALCLSSAWVKGMEGTRLEGSTDPASGPERCVFPKGGSGFLQGSVALLCVLFFSF